MINETHLKTEILLTARYLLQIGHELKWSLEDWWLALKNYFCIVSSSEIDFLEKSMNGNMSKNYQDHMVKNQID